GESARAGRGPFALVIRRQTGLSRGVKNVLVTGMTVATLLTSVATVSAQNFFEALFGRLVPSPGPVPDANFTARDRQQLAYPPYRQAFTPPQYRRQGVRYPPAGATAPGLGATPPRSFYPRLPDRQRGPL